MILAGVKEIPRGSSEPELAVLTEVKNTRVIWKNLPGLMQIRSLRFLFLQSLVGVLPWQVITFWSFRYLEVERNYTQDTISSIMVPAVLMIGAGYFLGGVFGDLVYRKIKSGRLLVSIAGIFLGAIFLTITLSIPLESVFAFRILLSLTCFFIPLASPNIATSVYDVVLPEVRSTATSIQYFLGNLGSAFAPLLAGAISEISSLQTALLSISLTAWLITAALLGVSLLYFKDDMEAMHSRLKERASAQSL
jgi:MFS family permease